MLGSFKVFNRHEKRGLKCDVKEITENGRQTWIECQIERSAWNVRNAHMSWKKDVYVCLCTYLNFVPVAIVQLSANGDDICTTTQVVSQSYGSFDQFNFEEVKCATVIGIQYQTIWLFRFEFKFQGTIQAGIPFAELCKWILWTIQ